MFEDVTAIPKHTKTQQTVTKYIYTVMEHITRLCKNIRA